VSAEYLVRFDDICPTMRWSVWDRVEPLLVEHMVKPIVAVVPDNHDRKLQVEAADPGFWERARGWQDRGWTIAMHGHQHRYVTDRAGVIGLNRRSEFAGRPEPAQRDALVTGLGLLRANGLEPTVWVAPAHSFDHITLRLLKELGLCTISDGYGALPYRDNDGMLWIPQQLWQFQQRSRGVWTVCIHLNGWGDDDIARFREHLVRFASRTTDVPSVIASYGRRRRSAFDRLADLRMRAGLRLRRAASRARRILPGR